MDEFEQQMWTERFDNATKTDKAILDKLGDLEANQKDLINRLFIDNNGDCIQSKINANSRAIKILSGIFATIGTAVLGWVLKIKFFG